MIQDSAIDASPARAGLSEAALARLRDALAADVARGRIPGAVVLVARGGELGAFDAIGYRDREAGAAMQRDTIFRAASMTKPVVCVAALMLMEAGLLHLNDPVSTYVPSFAGMAVGVDAANITGGVRPLRLESVEREMTVQDLMRHTSGLTYGAFGDSAVHKRWRDANVADRVQTNAEMLEKMARLPLVHQPGTTFEYSMSIDVLGAIVEIVSGLDLQRFIVERIAQPLGMHDTAFATADGERLAEPQIDPATGKRTDVTFLYDHARPGRWFSGGGGILTTAHDYYRFAQMLLGNGEVDGVRILARKSVALMTSDHLPPGVRYGSFTRALGITAPLPEFGQGFGLGVAVRTAPGRNPNPGSVGDYCWSGISGTYFWIDPAEELIAIYLMQAPLERIHYRSLMRNMVYASLI